MTQLDASRSTRAPGRRDTAVGTLHTPAAAIVAGVLLGVLDLALQRTLPYPWADLANSSAVWAVAAFALGAWTRRWQAGAVAGTLTLGVAVEGYYLAAIATLGDDLAVLWSTPTLIWLLFAVVAGPVFGAAGAWSRHPSPGRAAVALSLPVAVLLGEALLRAPSATAALTAGLAVALLGGHAVRRPLPALGALVLSLPFALACLAAFRLAGFGG